MIYFKLNIVFIFLFSVGSAYNQIEKNRFFGNYNYKEQNFIGKTQDLISHVKNPIGFTYWSRDFKDKKNGMVTDTFNQFGSDFLLNYGAQYDVICLSYLNDVDFNPNDKINKYYSSIATYQRLTGLKKEVVEESFYKKCKFEFVISEINHLNLPTFIKKDVVAFTYNPVTKIYFYRLNPN